MKKRLLSLFLAFAMIVSMLPATALAGEAGDDGTVYISASRDGEYLALNDGYLAYVPVKLSDLEGIDLETYGLSDYAYDADRDGTNEITALHLLIYAHEELYGGTWSEGVSVSGGAGSFFIVQGLFGWDDCNLQYRHNGVYPLQEGSTSTGATADQIILADGDFVDVAHFSSWGFYSDSAAGFHYFMDGNDATHAYTAVAGEELTVTLGRAASDMGGGTDLHAVDPTTYIDSDGSALLMYFGTHLYASDASETALDESGQAIITFDTAGTYYLWADGGCGYDMDMGNVVSSPAYAKVTVTGDSSSEEPEPEQPATYTVTLTAGEGYTIAAAEGSASPVAAGGIYAFTVTIDEGYEADEGFAVKANGSELAANEDGIYTISNITEDQTVTVEGVKAAESEGGEEEPAPEAQGVTITAPAGSIVSVGTMHNYYIYSFTEPQAVSSGDDGTVIYTFDVPTTSGNSFVRVQNPDGVTYWDYVKLEEGTSITITEDMLFMNDSKHNADTIIHDFSEYEMDVADVYINANTQGYLPMDVNETFEFNVFRDWHAVEGISNAKTALPDVSYQVIDINGNSSDVVTIVPDENNSSVATMTANEEGTAIVLVTYDAMYSTLALRGNIGTDPAEPAFFSAIWPENTGVLVVTVGSDSTSIETNMTLNNHDLDAEHDVLYYVGDEGASYTFTPEEGSTVSVARATLTDDSLTYNGFEAVEADENGAFTVSSLTAGSHIVKVENGGSATYQVICAKQTTVTVTDANGDEINADNPVDPGETITIQLGDLYNPVNKLSGIYNSNCAVTYEGEDKTVAMGDRGSGYGYYPFASKYEMHKVNFTLPEVWTKDTYSLSGYLSIGGFGSGAGAHRKLTYAAGKSQETNAEQPSAFYTRLPEVIVPVNASARIPATGITLNKSELTLALDGTEVLAATLTPENTTDPVVWTSEDSTVATVDANGVVTGIAAGQTTITATAGEVSATCTVTVTAETAEDIVLQTQSVVDGLFAADAKLLEITISGAKLAGEITGDRVDTSDSQVFIDNNCSIPLAAGDYETLTLTLKAGLGTLIQNAASKLYFYCNDSLSPAALNTYEDYIYTTSVNPVWEDDQATLVVGVAQNSLKNVKSAYTITLTREPPEGFYAVILPEETVGYTVNAANGSASPVAEGSSYSFTVDLADGYVASESFSVKANGVALEAVDGIYTIANITEKQTVTVEGVTVVETSPVFTRDENGIWGKTSYGWVKTLSIGGAEVKSHTWDGDTCYVTLGSDTPKDAKVFFVYERDGGMDSWAEDVSATLNGSALLPGVPGTVTLEDGQATAEVYAAYNTTGGTKTFVLTVEEPSSYDVTLSGLHSAQISDFQLYTYTDGVKGETDLLADKAQIADGYGYKYETTLAPGDYWVEGYDKNNDYNGGIAITVDADHTSFQIQRMYQIYATNSDWVVGTDYTIGVAITTADGEFRACETGTADNYGTIRTSCLFVVGDEVQATFTPIGDRAGSASAVTVKQKPNVNAYISTKIPQVFQVTITAPAGSTVSAGVFSDYYIYDFVTPTVTEDENGVTAVFRMPEITATGVQSANHFYRVQNPGGVTYWNFAKWTADTEVTVTAEDLYINDGTFKKDTVIDDYSKNIYDRADIYLNANHQGYLAMDLGETHEWNVFRNWMAIESFYNAKVALPDVHYEVITLEGENVISIVPDENNSSVANMTATGEGTAIVLITYDAMTHMQGQSSTASKQFSAIWPENTGVVIVTVGKDGTDIDTNMLMDRVGAESTVMDAEHDILFYLGEEGAEFTFTPESESTVTINRSVIENGEMTFKGFTADSVTTADGVVTLTGLTTGRHIVKVEKDGKANYQVITARQVSYELQDSNGNALTEGAEIRAGDTIKIQFTGLVNPVEKMSGAYNFNARIVLEGQDGTTYQSSAGGAYGVYDFSGNPARQVISITLPKYWDGETYTLNGNIAMTGNANVGLGGHRGFTYAYGFTFNENSPSASLTVSRLPEITLSLAETTFVGGKLVFVDEAGQTVERAGLTVTLTDDVNNKIIVAEDGSFPCVAGAYSYVICGAGYRYKTGSFTIAADDVNVTKKVVLERSSENAWDGTTKTEPEKDADGVYLIGTGAELAWFAAQQDAGKADISGKLTADIDLAGYPWTMTCSTSSYATVLDGAGHKIEDLNATVGLFSCLGSNSIIKDLTISGLVNGTGSAGSIVKYAYGSDVLIENCVNYATVSSTGSNVGGLVGYAYNGTTIKNCVNHGAVSGSASVGGIIGSFSGASTVESCYNTGAVTATANCAGGIFGNTGSAATITGCYNTGAVSGANYVGGVGGNLDGPSWGAGNAALSDCYSTGSITGTGANVGGVVGKHTAAKATLARGYSLEGTAADNGAGTVLTAEELKQASLDGTLFGGTCTGYPALLWQTDVTFHRVGETATEIVGPTCLEDGYSLYICDSCEQSTKKDIVDALGHSWCDEGEGAHSHAAEACETCEHCVYTAAVCGVNASCTLTCTREGCEVTKTKDLGGALSHEYCTHTTAAESENCGHCVIIPATCVENGSVVRNCVREGCDNEKAAEVIPFTGHTASGEADAEGLYTCSVCEQSYKVIAALDASETEYAWVWKADKQRFESTNQTKGSTTSTGTFTLTLTEEATVSFRYGVSSENGWDKLTITAAAGETALTIANAISGSTEGTFGQKLAAGTYTLTASFSKDVSGDRNEDLGWISAITVTYGEAAGSEPEQPVTPDWQTIMNKTQAYLTAQAEETAPVVDTFKGEWMVLGLARNGVTADFMDAYYENVKTYVAANIDENGRLHASKSTDNSRVILGLTAIGKDVTDVAGYDLLKGLSDLNYVKNQGINGPVFALIALDSKDYSTADNATATREALVEYILSKQLTDGGWALDGRNIDDMTPMAIQALAPYYNSNEDVKAAVDKALTAMSTMTATPETYAQMIVALSALGIDCETDERFADVLDNLLTFALEDGSFEKGAGSGANQMTTEQAFYGLVAYNRFKNGQSPLYDMTDVASLYPVEILPSENGSITASKTAAAAGETITVTAQPLTGYVLSKLTLNDVELTIAENSATFTMPAGTAILEAAFAKTANTANAIAEAMLALDVEDAGEENYDLIEELREAYSGLTAAEKLEIREAYDAFMDQIDTFEEYLEEAVEEAAEELEWFFDDLDEEDYSKKAWDKIEDLYGEALEALEEARFEEEVLELLETYLEELEEAAAGELEVTFRLIGDWKHDDGVDGHDEYVTWIETTEYNMPAGSTIYDLFMQAMDDFDLNQKGASKNYVESIQAPDILGGYWLGEFDNGPNSGWMYTINGDHPGYGLKEQDLEDGDEVIWHYVDDYTLEERKTTSKYYERWLEADDIAPETWVKHNLDKIVEIEGQGEVTPELKVSHIGKDVTFKFEPAEGWVIKTVYVDGKDKGAIESYKYKDLSMASRIEVVFALDNQPYFVDVPETEWFYEDVMFVVGSGLFNGTGEYTFSPNASMTRAMLVTVLYRLEGQPAVYGSSFADVQSGQWYSNAVVWAARNGIVTGYDNGKFGVNDNVTREQMAAILYRYANYKGYDVIDRAYLNGYIDSGSISGYAVDAMSWANAEGLVNGRTYNTLAPTGTATRAEVAAIFHRFVENIVK